MATHSELHQLRQFFRDGGALHMLNDTPREEMDTLWRYACQLLQQGNPAGARNLLQLLVTADHWNSQYLLTLGVACQQTGAHHDAYMYLAQAARVLVTDPRPAWLMANSARALNEFAGAVSLYENALILANNQVQWRELTREATRSLAECRQRLQPEQQTNE